MSSEIGFDTLFSQKVEATLKKIPSSTKTVIVPSVRDVQHAFVYPQYPFASKNTESLKFVSNPCTLIINGVSIGLTSVDILKHIGAEETSR